MGKLVLSRKSGEKIRLYNRGTEPLVIEPGQEIAVLTIGQIGQGRSQTIWDLDPRLGAVRSELPFVSEQISIALPVS